MASNINYRGIMDRLTELAGGGNIFEQQERKKRQDYAAIDARNAMQQDFENKRALQSDLLAGNMNVARENNAGALARQQLQGEFGLKDTGIKGDYGLQQERIRGDFGLRKSEMDAQNQANADLSKLMMLNEKKDNTGYAESVKGIWADLNMTPEQKFEATRKAYEMFYGGGKPTGIGGQTAAPTTGGSAASPTRESAMAFSSKDAEPSASPVVPGVGAAIQPTSAEKVRTNMPAPSTENLSLFSKRGFGLLNTQAEIDANKQKNQSVIANDQKTAMERFSPEAQKKRRKEQGGWL